MSNQIIAIDGPAGAGKTTCAKYLAENFDGFFYLDTGAVYRTIAYGLREAGFSLEDIQSKNGGKRFLAALDHVEKLPIEIGHNPDTHEQTMWLYGKHIPDDRLRTPLMSEMASVCSESPTVRRYANNIIRAAAQDANLIAEGRDTGSELFPDAGLKFYLWAQRSTRAERRLRQAGETFTNTPVAESMAKIEKTAEEIGIRDQRDASREHAPLMIPDGAFWIDTTDLSEAQVKKLLLDAVKAHYHYALVI